MGCIQVVLSIKKIRCVNLLNLVCNAIDICRSLSDSFDIAVIGTGSNSLEIEVSYHKQPCDVKYKLTTENVSRSREDQINGLNHVIIWRHLIENEKTTILCPLSA